MTKEINETPHPERPLNSRSIELKPWQQGHSLARLIGINGKIRQIKQWVPAILLPLVLLQTPVFAQTESPSEVNQPTTATEVVPPTLVPLKGTEQIHLQLVNCGWWLDCALARLLLPASAFINQRELQFDNSTQVPVKILNTATIVEGDLTGYQLNNQAISLPQELKSLPANQIVSIPLTLNRAVMPPDRYSGAIYLTLKERSDRLWLPVNLSARSSPLLPLIVLFFGVILGRLFKSMQERGEPQAKALEEVYRLQADIAGAKLEERDKQLLAEMVKEVQTLVFREKLDVVPAQVQTLRERTNSLVKESTTATPVAGKSVNRPSTPSSISWRYSSSADSGSPSTR
jgi:hypothetical protein